MICANAMAQEPTTEIIPPSPDAASLGKYGEVPVSMYSGIPSINVPLYEIRNKDISVPISLSYHAGGIKVEEEASWVGLGWSLNAGGVITRTLRGLDDIQSGLNTTIDESELDQVLNPAAATKYTDADATLIMNLANGVKDGEPDIFFFNFMGYSGKFIYSLNDDKVTLITQDDIEITLSGDINTLSYYWTVKTPDGYTYEFKAAESTIPVNASYGDQFLSSWYLTKIISPTNNTVNFIYKDGVVETLAGFSVVSKTPTGGDPTIEACPGVDGIGTFSSTSYSLIATKTLDKITFDNGEVAFSSSLKRADLLQDLALNPRGYKLDYIQVKENGKLKRDIYFSHSFFSVSGTESQIENFQLATSGTAERYNAANHRLKLDAVWFDDKSYQFQYYREHDLPRKDSKKQDHWGYILETSLPDVPATLIPVTTSATSDCSGSGVVTNTTRDSSPGTYNIGLLQRIVYPTKGYSEFIYEPNMRGTQISVCLNNVIGTLNANSENAPTDRWMGFRAPTGMEGFSLYVNQTIANPLDNNGTNFGVKVYEVENWTNEAINEMEILGTRTLADMTLADAINPSVVISHTSAQNQTYDNISLVPNKYYLLNVNATAFQSSSEGWLFAKFSDVQTVEQIIGGARIKQIISNDDVDVQNNIVKSYEYVLSSGTSSGRLVTIPKYSATYDLYLQEKNSFFIDGNGNLIIVEDPNEEISCAGDKCNITEIRSYSRPLGSTSGQHFGYSRVIEYSGTESTNNGYVINEFSPPTQTPGADVFPYTVGDNQDFRFGKLTDQYVYDSSDKLVKELHNTYGEKNLQTSPAVKVFNHFIHWEGYLEYNTCGFSISDYRINSAFFYLKSTQEIAYSSTGDGTSVETISNFYYDKADVSTSPHYQLTKSTSTDSKGLMVTEYTYPLDIASPNTSEQNLIGEHKLNALLEKKVFHEKNSVSTLLSKQKIRYDNSFPLPIEAYNAVRGMDYDLDPDVTISYNANGNVKEVLTRDGVKTSYIWSYNQSFPVAKIVNIGYSEIDPAIISNIEGHTFTNSSDYDDIQIDVNFLKTQLVSLLSDPRYMITLYTYDPLEGMTSQTDPNGLTTNYEYDGSGRLKNVFDFEGNILKHIEYHYKY